MADDIAGYIMGQMAGDQRASSARIDADRAQMDAQIARQGAAAASDRALLAMGFAQQQINAWRARFERERADRRGWQRNGIAARELIQKLANVDREGAQKMIDACAAENKDRLDKSIAGIDEWNFTGVKPTSN